MLAKVGLAGRGEWCGSMAGLLDDDSVLLSCGIAGRQSPRPSIRGEPKPERRFSPREYSLPLLLLSLVSGLLMNLSPLSRRPGLAGESSFTLFPVLGSCLALKSTRYRW